MNICMYEHVVVVSQFESRNEVNENRKLNLNTCETSAPNERTEVREAGALSCAGASRHEVG